MQTTIKNQDIIAVVNHKGAELTSLIKGDKNIIWKVDTQFWNKTSPVLFPIVGALKEGKYVFNGKEYKLPRHGFARDYIFELVGQDETSAVFSLKSNEETLKVYPFSFEFLISYSLNKNVLTLSYTFKNLGVEKMYYSVGAHPAFAINGKIEDYSLQFDKQDSLTTYKLTQDLFSGETKKIPLKEKYLPLNYKLFEEDAIVLKNNTTSSLLLLKNNIPEIKVSFSDFPYLGIWSKQEAPFLCIEPWQGIADNSNTNGLLQQKEGIQELEAQSEKSAKWSIEVF